MKHIRSKMMLIIVSFMMIIGITISTTSQAFMVVKDNVADGVIVDHHFYPNTQVGPGTWFCIQPGGNFSISGLLTQAEYDQYPVNTYLPVSGVYCLKCNPDAQKPWENDTKYYYQYEEGETFSFSEYPDAAYVLADMTEKGNLLSWDTAYGIWNSRVSNPKRIGGYDIVGESKAYDTFYQTIHGGYTSNDIFESLISDHSNNIKVAVNQEEGYYEIGPFRGDYPNGVYNGLNKFSWIESMEMVTNVGTFPVRIFLRNRQEINIADLGENGTQTLSGKEYYVRFYSTEATQGMLKTQYGYLEHCEAEMKEYKGKRYYRNFEYESVATHAHTTPAYTDGAGVHHDAYTINYATYKYKITDKEGSESQTLMALSGTASKVRKSVVKYISWERPPTTITIDEHNPEQPPRPVGDLTMDLAGAVFLDQDTGKVNEGNNRLDSGEGLAGIEVTLCDAEGNPVDINYKVMHKHTGDPKLGTGCYSVPVYHTHLGDELHYGNCYTMSTHQHTGSQQYGTGCYSKVYHTHTEDCYQNGLSNHEHKVWCYNTINYIRETRTEHQIPQPNGDVIVEYDDITVPGTMTWDSVKNVYVTDRGVEVPVADVKNGLFYDNKNNEGRQERCTIGQGQGNVICGKTESTLEGNITCGMDENTIIGYTTSCGQEVRYEKTCQKDETTIDYYAPGCGKTETTVEKEINQGSTVLTDSHGGYVFRYLNAQKVYYIKFVYNGMLYTNVPRLIGNAANTSKATEDAQGHTGNRQRFNDQFKEIGSNPENYMSPSRGAYNQVFLQENIADTFKTIANNHGTHGNTDEEVFAYDCRIQAFSTEKYPLTKVFTIDSFDNVIAGKNYEAIYKSGGQYDQLHINLGIKARPTFDLRLSKDVHNAILNINGKEEVYTYSIKQMWKNEDFNYIVNEDYYLNQLREKYISGTSTNMQTKATIDPGTYTHEFRTEEVVNGNNQTIIGINNGNNLGISNENNSQQEPKEYAWRDINHNLAPEDKLQVHITYKIGIQNQSRVVGAITELVDYYDSHYQFEKAYVGDENGNQIAGTNVDVRDDQGNVLQDGNVIQWQGKQKTGSIYGTNTQAKGNGQWKMGETRGYKTIYLNPTEQKLYKDHIDQYVYVTFGLIDPENTLIQAGLPNGNKFYTYNLAEINGYKTYTTFEDYENNIDYYNQNPQMLANSSMGLIDRNSNPGNFNPTTYEMGVTKLEDDENRAPAYAYTIRTSRTIEGNVFEDALSQDATASKDPYEVKVATTRFGNGTIENGDIDKRIKDVKVELVEVKHGKLVVRSTTHTNADGWYGFGAFLPGDYTIRFTYGAEDGTALTTTSQYSKGSNDTSYNGQDYQSTTYGLAVGQSNIQASYKVDDILNAVYTANNNAKNSEEQTLPVSDQKITKYQVDGYYWYDDSSMLNRSDATDDEARRHMVNAYASSEYGRNITNHKAEVFNSYINQAQLRNDERGTNFNEFTQAQPMEQEVDTEGKNRQLVEELKRRTYMYAYTPEIPIEVEYTKKQIGGNKASKEYTYKVIGVDFGVTQRPRAQLTIDQDIAHVKVTASDGTTLLELRNRNNGTFEVVVDNQNSYQWLNIAKTEEYEKDELVNVILDDELLNGSKLEVTYNITVTNNSEAGIGTSRATNIINYVANNLNFDVANNNGLWEVVKKEDIQTGSHATLINSENRDENLKLVDLSTQTTVLKATANNPLVLANLEPGKSVTSTLTLTKTISAESSADDLAYNNMSEIVEIDNTQGRYDHGAIPGNQEVEEQPREHDASGASRYDEINQETGLREKYRYDGRIIITPPTGSKRVYYWLGIVGALILVGGIILIKKFVIKKK